MEVPAELCDLIRMHQKMLGLTHQEAAARVRKPRFSTSRWRQVLSGTATAPEETVALMCVAVRVDPEMLRRIGQPALAAKVMVALAVAAEPTDTDVVLNRMADFLPESGLCPEHQEALLAVTLSLLTMPQRWAHRAMRRPDRVAESLVRDLRTGRLGQCHRRPAAVTPNFAGLDPQQAFLTDRNCHDSVQRAQYGRVTDGFVTARAVEIDDHTVAVFAPDQLIEVLVGDLRCRDRHGTGR